MLVQERTLVGEEVTNGSKKPCGYTFIMFVLENVVLQFNIQLADVTSVKHLTLIHSNGAFINRDKMSDQLLIIVCNLISTMWTLNGERVILRLILRSLNSVIEIDLHSH